MSGNSLTLVLLKTQIKNIWHMAKVNIKSEKITSFGGIYYASKAFYALSLDKVINVCLPLYRRMRQMDKDGKKMVAEFVYRHAVWQTFFWIDTFFSRLLNLNPQWGKGRCVLIRGENGALPFIFAKKTAPQYSNSLNLLFQFHKGSINTW